MKYDELISKLCERAPRCPTEARLMTEAAIAIDDLISALKASNDVIVKKFQTSYVAFYLDGRMIAHMQVKFNNGFIEKCKKQKADIIEQGVRMSYGMPFSSWNFSVEK